MKRRRRTDATDSRDKIREAVVGNSKSASVRFRRRQKRDKGWKEGKEISRYCGDWNSRIKLLRKTGDKIIIKILSSKSTSFPRFRAKAKIMNNVPSSQVHSSNQGLVSQSNMLCDNQRFVLYRNECYFVATYPEVSWNTASQICLDIESNLLEIKDNNQEKNVIDLLTTNVLGSDLDFSSSSVSFWIKKNSRDSILSPFYGSDSTHKNDLGSFLSQEGFMYDPYKEPTEDWVKPFDSNVNLESHLRKPQSKNILSDLRDFGTRGGDEQRSDKTSILKSIGSQVTETNSQDVEKPVKVDSRGSNILGINSNQRASHSLHVLSNRLQNEHSKCTAAFLSTGTTSYSIIYDDISCSEQIGYICTMKPIGMFDYSTLTNSFFLGPSFTDAS